MAQSRRLSPKILQEDIDALDALEAIADYKPANPAYSKENALAVRQATQEKQAKETQDAATAKASRDAAVAGEWERHDFVQNVRKQALAQYGEDSDEIQALGLKKKSEYKRKGVKKPPPTP